VLPLELQSEEVQQHVAEQRTLLSLQQLMLTGH
jgi:hypothetical protein